MLVPLLPTQISNNWEFFAPKLLEALPPAVRYSDAIGANMLRAILGGDLKCWGVYWPDREDGKLHALLTTVERYDVVTGQKTLLIYTLTGLMDIGDVELWKSTIKTLLRYGKETGCAAVVAYTANRGVKSLIERFGGDAEYTFLELKLN